MKVEMKIRKVGNSLGVVLPKEVISRMNVAEGDSLVLTDAPEGNFKLTPNKEDFAHQMDVVSDIARRYRNALRELAK